ncbi:probable aminopeptidase NPEPL1 [Oscarella lobularis]|uniref:probable aminopeptidase NPEPL1 n=1 Tax=Oscarella lobularis TaxID=121494 RepID=UPI0033136F83
MAELVYSTAVSKSDPLDRTCLIVGQVPHVKQIKFERLANVLSPRVDEETFQIAVDSLRFSSIPSNACATCPLWLNGAFVAGLPPYATRHNSDARPHALARAVQSTLGAVGGDRDEIIVVVCEKRNAFASASAIARVYPKYSAKSGKQKKTKTVTIDFVFVGEGDDAPLSEDEAKVMSSAAEGIRLAAQMVDTPCNLMHTDIFLDHVRAVGDKVHIKPVIIQGEDLVKHGFGGIYGVGKAAVHAPALAILSHTPKGATKTIAWVGKGIVYDTGGLSIKDKLHMPGMKRDCGGAAAILGAFQAAVTEGFSENLHAVFCLAENAVGPEATRPDDIHTFYSGKTVEINNTDAEGRLVLGDGVAYARKDLKADIVVDMATLTGAQGISTGRYHAGLLTNDGDWETACQYAGRASGDLVFPLPYTPEFHFAEFNSSVADMKNSVANRSNAQSSCAGLFINSHLGFDFPGTWIHLDIAAPVYTGERATGYGVALLMCLFSSYSKSALLSGLASSFQKKSPADDDAKPPPSKKRRSGKA